MDGEFGLFLEVQQGSQTPLSVGTGNMEFHSSRCHGISPYVELRGHDILLSYSRDIGVLLEFQQVRQSTTSSVCGTLVSLSNQKLRIGPHLEMIWGTWSSSRGAVLTSVFI